MKLIDYFTLRHLFISLSGALATFATEAQIATDGTVGPAQRLTGPNYAIGADLGTQRGANLFHSFSTFNLQTQESATFTGPVGLQNVISRVTGGEWSTIDGALRSEISGANFFFINPAGVVFGADAQVDVPAAFHVSTADEVRLADGEIFSAANPGISTLSAAPPATFGFLGPHRGRIGFEGSRLTFALGSRVTVSAGEISIRDGTLVVEGGDLALTALGETTGAVPVNEVFAGEVRGRLTIENSQWDLHNLMGISVSGDGGGGLWLRAGETRLHNAVLFADNTGARDATRGIDMDVESLTAEQSWITNDVYASGAGGDTTVTVRGTLSLLNGGVIGAGTISTANTGNITVTARNLLIDSQGFTDWNTGILSSTTNVGDAGDVTITAGNLFMDGQGAAIFSDTYEGIGAGGNVTVTVADSLDMRNGSIIRADTRGAGDAGNVVLSAGNLKINRQGSSGVTGISSRAYPDSTGVGGNILIRVSNTLSLFNGGAIGTSTYSTAAAGDITITAGNLLIDMQGAERFTGISSNAAEGTGAAGNIHMTVADTLSLLNGGAINASTRTSGNAGNIKIAAGNMLIENLGNITSSANPGSSGRGGNIGVAVTGSLSLLNGGQISTSTWTDGGAGEITVIAPAL